MTTDEAWAVTMKALEDLREAGVEVKATKRLPTPESVATYSGPERVPPALWQHVSLTASTNLQRAWIATKEDMLHSYGIRFDTGGGFGSRDWELDWSWHHGPDTTRAGEVHHLVGE